MDWNNIYLYIGYVPSVLGEHPKTPTFFIKIAGEPYHINVAKRDLKVVGCFVKLSVNYSVVGSE